MTKGDSRGSWVIIITALALAASCAEPTTFTAQAPTVPVLRLPRNDVYQGSVLTGSLRPIFTWEASTAPSAPIRYELQYSTDRSFTAADVVTVNADEPRFQPDANLPVSPVPPVGRRYYWHVRACVQDSCSAYSPTWWVNLGRSAKDFNGDGYADVLVGAPIYQDRGAAFVYFGGPGPSLDTNVDGVLDDSVRYDRLGSHVSGAGDFNGDGFADVAIASGRKTFLYFGGPGPVFDDAPDVIFPELPSTSGVWSLAAGDLNADGFSDLMIGDPNNNGMGIGAGRVHVYYGGEGGALDVPDGSLSGQVQYQAFGHYVSSAGDLNGDGFADVAVSSGSFDDDLRNECFADIFFGRPGKDFDSLKTVRLKANTTDQCTSRTVMGGDVDGDGFADLIMGIQNSTTADQIEIFRGGSQLISSAAGRVDGRTEGLSFLNGVVPAGDINGDGSDDFMLRDEGSLIRISVYLGKPITEGGGVATPAAARLPTGSFASAGDVNGDGFDDIIVGDGAIQYKAFIYFGGPGGSFDATADWILAGTYTFGNAVARTFAKAAPTST